MHVPLIVGLFYCHLATSLLYWVMLFGPDPAAADQGLLTSQEEA